MFDSLKLDYLQEDSSSEDSELSNWENLDDNTFSESLAQIALKDNPKDKDWIPEKLKRAIERQEVK